MSFDRTDPTIHKRNEVADTILQQLGGAQFIAMTGAKSLAITEKPGLSFRLPTRSGTLPNYVRITLNPMDEYDVQFARIRGTQLKILSMHENVPVENLVELFERQTSLYTKLF